MLQDLADGMNEFGLVDFLKKHKDVIQPQLFPQSTASIINKDDLKRIIEIEEEEEGVHCNQLMLFLKQYIDLIDGTTSGANLKDLLSFWTGCDLLPANGAILHLKVDRTKDRTLLPESRTCFHLLVLPCYENFDELKAKLDRALQFGSRGFTNI
ncbi:uncharacterized protein LOC124440504 [Xenia sp. Carnegie-2017]|uniref:uncharacterized protein LOC124440504 n=1 Tax=Xenia sp. Carnegie-2017 TaxID=2897299 RepID=UPI001F04422F|nr:uncharacterized protein LOC124440504 [Xenia sp. Carnegie-2017]